MGCRYKTRRLKTVVLLAADVYLQSPDVIALRVRSARAGLVPLPLAVPMKLGDQIVRESRLPRHPPRDRRRPAAADHLAPAAHPGHRGTIHIDQIELRDGELVVAGHTPYRTAPTGGR